MKSYFTIPLLLVLYLFSSYGFSSTECPSQIKQSSASVFFLLNPYTGYGGTGFLTDSNRLITNFHVVQGLLNGGNSLENIIVLRKTRNSTDKNTTSNSLQIKNIIALSGVADLALLEIKGTEDRLPLTIRKAPLKEKEELFILGYPRGNEGNLHISRKTGSLKEFSQMQHFFVNYPDLHGFSGSPVTDVQGQVVGISFSGRENLIISAPANQLRHFIAGNIGHSCIRISPEQCLDKTIALLHEKAEQGNIQAQLNLGEIYYGGRGVQQSYKRAFYWWNMAAEQGDASAQILLVRAYSKGEGVKQSDELAIYWAKLGAVQAHAIAQSQLSLIYSEKNNNYQEAFYWMELSAKQGYNIAQILLAIIYSEGEGVEQNDELAIYWAEQAIKQGLDQVRNWLARTYPHYQLNIQRDDSCNNSL